MTMIYEHESIMPDTQEPLFGPQEVGDEEVARSLLDQLLTDSKLFKSTGAYKQLMEFVVRLRNVAPFNAMLLQLQKPGLTYAASAHDWQTRFNRRVKEDARPLLILWPFGPVATVYDVLDTYDPENPEPDNLPPNLTSFFATGEMTADRIRGFKPVLKRKNIDLVWVDHGDAQAGRIQRIDGDAKRNDDKDEHVRYLIKLNQNHGPAVQFTTLAHELAHLCLGHLGSNKKLNVPQRRSLTHAEVEVEAESVAYLVCERNQVKSKSEAYLCGFVDDRVTVGHIDLYQIMRAAGQVETLLDLTAHTKFHKPKAK